MGHSFKQHKEAELPASPEEVWAAIATGQGIDSWFMGRNDVRPGAGGTVRTAFGEYQPELAVTAWDPLRQFAYASAEAGDGRFIAYEFLIEAQGTGSTVLRAVTSGFLPGDDWEDEYDAMTKGGEMYFRTLVEYLTFFAGRFATPITAFCQSATDWDRALPMLHQELGLTEPVAPGDRVRFTPEGLTPIDGVVYLVSAHALGVRTGDALYRFLRGFDQPVIAAHHLFSRGVDRDQAERAWQSWLSRLLA
jgi:uncharacterized protein YndB with AHSA1/START domain